MPPLIHMQDANVQAIGQIHFSCTVVICALPWLVIALWPYRACNLILWVSSHTKLLMGAFFE